MPGRRKKFIWKNPHRMLVISWDAVGNQDLAALETLPHLRSLMERAACCRRVKSVCPSLTYPAHAAIVTGRNPSHTGIVNNIRLQPFRRSRTGSGRGALSGEQLFMTRQRRRGFGLLPFSGR